MLFEGPEQSALFQIEGPDDDGCVWICSVAGSPGVWCQNLGPAKKVARIMSQWLTSVQFDEAPGRYQRANPG